MCKGPKGQDVLLAGVGFELGLTLTETEEALVEASAAKQLSQRATIEELQGSVRRNMTADEQRRLNVSTTQ